MKTIDTFCFRHGFEPSAAPKTLAYKPGCLARLFIPYGSFLELLYPRTRNPVLMIKAPGLDPNPSVF